MFPARFDIRPDSSPRRTLTSWPSLKTDIRNAGGHWQDEPVVASRERGWTLITSRKPADLDAFNTAFVEAFAE